MNSPSRLVMIPLVVPFSNTFAPDNRFALGIGNDTLYGDSFLLCSGYVFDAFTSFGQDYIFSFHYISDVCSGKYLVQKFGYGFVFCIYINSAPYVDTLLLYTNR